MKAKPWVGLRGKLHGTLGNGIGYSSGFGIYNKDSSTGLLQGLLSKPKRTPLPEFACNSWPGVHGPKADPLPQRDPTTSPFPELSVHHQGILCFRIVWESGVFGELVESLGFLGSSSFVFRKRRLKLYSCTKDECLLGHDQGSPQNSRNCKLAPSRQRSCHGSVMASPKSQTLNLKP